MFLICGRDPERLGIVDKEGVWDTYKFLQHCEECKICEKFMEAFCAHIDRQMRIEYLMKNVGSPSVSIH